MKASRVVWTAMVGLFLVVLSGGTPFCAEAASGPLKLMLSWVTVDAPTDPYAVCAHKFKEEIEKASGGKIEVTLHGNAELGGERDVIEGISLGLVDMAVMTNAPLGSFVPQMQVLDLPFIFEDAADAREALDGPKGKQLISMLEKVNITTLGFAEGGFRNTGNNVRPINRPEDFNGIKIRTMESRIYLETFKALGANPVPMAWPELYTAIAQGVVDAMECPPPVFEQGGFPDVVKYYSLTKHTYSPLPFIISKQRWESFSAEQQKLISDAAKIAIEFNRSTNDQLLEAILNKISERGCQVNDIESLSPFREKVTPVYAVFEGTIGKDIIEMFTK
ncbi:MAG: TRAP-type transport system periplasmic protein [Synergistaceae bacterium]|nr:TRAP-type transport system periplasmic protein [Synergistaceae bacterium]